MYAELNPDEKQVWVQHAENDKQRYLAQLAHYQPAPGYDRKGDAIAGVLSVYESRGRSGAQRDPKAPKRCLSAYLVSTIESLSVVLPFDLLFCLHAPTNHPRSQHSTIKIQCEIHSKHYSLRRHLVNYPNTHRNNTNS